MPNLILIFFVTFLLQSCNESGEEETSLKKQIKDCRGEWSERDSSGDLKKYEEYWHEGLESCVTENRALTTWEESLEKRRRNSVSCEPQYGIPTLYLKSANNYYSYRNGKIFLELNSDTGQFRRLILGEQENGEGVFIREIGCFYQREDVEVEPVNPQDYGKQLLLDLELAASSKSLHPMEIYRYHESSPGNWEMTRFDQNDDIDWTFCTPDSLPWGFCDYLRNGNIFYYPDDPSPVKQTQLKAEAILIRSEYNWVEISESEFSSLWNFHASSSDELGAEANFKYGVIGIPDVPLYVHRAWRDYLMRERPAMPDAYSITVPYICYDAQREVVLNSGDTSLVDGEVCYEDGEYVFR